MKGSDWKRQVETPALALAHETLEPLSEGWGGQLCLAAIGGLYIPIRYVLRMLSLEQEGREGIEPYQMAEYLLPITAVCLFGAVMYASGFQVLVIDPNLHTNEILLL